MNNSITLQTTSLPHLLKKQSISLLTKEYNAWYDESPKGYIAKVDLVDESIINIFEISIHPFDISITKNNQLLISTQYQLFSVNSENGELIDSVLISNYSHLNSHPKENIDLAL